MSYKQFLEEVLKASEQGDEAVKRLLEEYGLDDMKDFVVETAKETAA